MTKIILVATVLLLGACATQNHRQPAQNSRDDLCRDSLITILQKVDHIERRHIRNLDFLQGPMSRAAINKISTPGSEVSFELFLQDLFRKLPPQESLELKTRLRNLERQGGIVLQRERANLWNQGIQATKKQFKSFLEYYYFKSTGYLEFEFPPLPSGFPRILEIRQLEFLAAVYEHDLRAPRFMQGLYRKISASAKDRVDLFHEHARVEFFVRGLRGADDLPKTLEDLPSDLRALLVFWAIPRFSHLKGNVRWMVTREQLEAFVEYGSTGLHHHLSATYVPHLMFKLWIRRLRSAKYAIHIALAIYLTPQLWNAYQNWIAENKVELNELGREDSLAKLLISIGTYQSDLINWLKGAEIDSETREFLVEFEKDSERYADDEATVVK